ncbi:hypothetical protein LXM94_04590 [Rhizobium sp. TRM95111]|uniref:hypothetical protein n=1 Tax=Rhizobium alarense TaxID=2846851 RepID=UPI001F3C511B|nr:hypothetical protein [Rhizobium alarense]MCF3639239.1 hypothetical protein [Rhizobium alarense]
MRNKALAIFALAVMAAFLFILLWRVPRLDLGVVIVLVTGMAAYDFLLYRQNGKGD